MRLLAFGLLLIYFGFQLGRATRNWVGAIRTRRTLSNDTIWYKTHRLGRGLFMVAGVFSLMGAIVPQYGFWLVIVPTPLAVMVPVVYSFFLYHQEEIEKN